jgi:hypothetical protein
VLSIEKHKKILKRKLDPKQADIIYKKLSLLFANQRIPANRLIFLHKYIIQDQLNSEETEIKKKLFPYHTDSKNIELFFNKNITLIELAKKI